MIDDLWLRGFVCGFLTYALVFNLGDGYRRWRARRTTEAT